MSEENSIITNISPEGTRVSERSIFIWLDILGFSTSIENDDNYNQYSEKLSIFRNAFIDTQYDLHNISDGMVLMLPNSLNYERLLNIFNTIAHKQYQYIIEQKEFIRGGIAVGTRFEENENKHIISNGLARAYKIESRSISWPIIGTNRVWLEKINNMLSVMNPSENLRLCETKNIKGEPIYFIDFIINPDEIYPIIRDKINEYSESTDILYKYIWMLRYVHKKFNRKKVPRQLKGNIL